MNAENTQTNVLYTHTSSDIGGGNNVLIPLFAGINRRRYKPLSVIPESGPLESELSSLGVPYKMINFRPLRFRRAFQCLNSMSLGLMLRTHRISLFHANDPGTYRVASMGSFFTNVKRICHVHLADHTREDLAWAFKRRPHCIIAPSNYLADLIKSLICEMSGVAVSAIWNPIDTDWFLPASNINDVRNRYGLSSNSKHVSIVGEVIERKGYDVFLKAAKMITEVTPQCMFHIVGGFRTDYLNYAESLKCMAAELEIFDRVRFWGFQDKKGVRDILQASDLFILPTRSEAFGLAVVEAQACGIPVLSSAIRPLDEVVSDGVTGFLFPPDSPEQFAAGALMLLQNEGTRRAMSASARNWAVSKFNVARFCNSIKDLYDSLLDR